MKIFSLLILLFFSLATYAAEYPTTYSCESVPGGFNSYEGIIKLTVIDSENFLVNDIDEAQIDETYKANSSSNKNLKRLIGNFQSLKQCDHDTFPYLLINRYILNTAKFGFIKYVCKGEDGYSSILLRCSRL